MHAAHLRRCRRPCALAHPLAAAAAVRTVAFRVDDDVPAPAAASPKDMLKQTTAEASTVLQAKAAEVASVLQVSAGQAGGGKAAGSSNLVWPVWSVLPSSVAPALS